MSLLITICALHFVAQLSPGPDVLLIAQTAASNTKANTLKIIAGISTGIIAWVVLTLSGFTVLVEQFSWIQQVLMLVGGLFLARMGWAMWWGGWHILKAKTSMELQATSTEPQSVKNYFLLGLLTNLSNPKTLIYFSSVFSLALSSAANENLKLQLAWIIPIQTFLTFTVLMQILSIAKIKAWYQGSSAYIDLISGALFLLFAVWLWLDAIRLF